MRCGSFLWGCVKDCRLLPQVPQGLPEMRSRIMVAISETDLTSCSGYGGKWTVGLKSVSQRVGTYRVYKVREKEVQEFLFPLVGRMLQYFLPYRCVPIVWNVYILITIFCVLIIIYS